MERISVKTNKRVEMIDITAEIQRVVGRCGLSSGVCVVFCPHTTAGLTINENADPDVRSDMVSIVNKIVPAENGYKHAEGNSDSHMKASLFGPSLSVIVENGGLQLGQWQAVYLCEADGPRTRDVWVKTVRDQGP